MKKKNIYVTLPNKVKLQISEEAQEDISKLREKVLGMPHSTDMITYLINVCFDKHTSCKAEAWFKNRAHCKDLEMHQTEIEKLEQIIENMKMKIT